jgi:predicted ATPase/class 3 adenylate cyclase
MAMSGNLPSGTVTFLFTDIEGSTRLWQEKPDAMFLAHARHNEILKSAIASNRGYVFQVIGDAFCAAFHTAGDALRAATQSQLDLQNEHWGEAVIKVRMGIHIGEAEIQENGDYRGFLTMSRLQRLMSVAHGGQVLISLATQDLVQNHLPPGISLRDMGARRLKDWARPEKIYQLVIQGLPSDFPPLKTLDTYRHNLPAQMTSFIGRAKEIEEIKDVLRAYRLVTLTGSGGTGKTRLSLQVAGDLLDTFPDGVYLVDLAPLTDPGVIAQTILSALEASEQQGKSALQSLIEHIRGKKLLLILDNCEHLIEASANLAETLLSSAPELKIMASSREALGIKGEMSWHVPSMSLPDAKALVSLEELSQCESIRLFIERALLAQPRFRLTKDNAPHVAQICCRLDGIPLAIELAAARVKALSTEQIAARLDDRFHLLTGGSRTALPRQQTLRAMIDWSYNLLSEREKRLLRRMAVFVGGWTLEAAEQVCVEEGIGPVEGGDLDILDLLTHLVDKSLVIMDETPKNVRYRMLETTRQYAREMLMMSEETRMFRNRHLDYYLRYAELAQSELRGRQQLVWLSLLDLEHDNLRAALEWSLETRPELGLRITAALYEFWDTRGYIAEARKWLDETLSKTKHLEPAPARVDALFGAAALAVRQSELDTAKKLLDQELALARALNYRRGIAKGLTARGLLVEIFENELEQAEAGHSEALAIYRETGDKLSIGQALGPLAACALKRYDFERAESLYSESLALFREVQNEREIAGALENLAEVALQRCNYAAACSFVEESLSLYRELEDKHGIATALRALGIAIHNQGNLAQARSACEESASIFREIGDRSCLILTLSALARQIHHQGNLQQALDLIREARMLLDEVGKEVAATSVFDVYGRIALAQGNSSEAQRQFQDGLVFQRDNKDVHFIPSLLEGFACEIAISSQSQDAIRLFGAANVIRKKYNLPMMQLEYPEYEQVISRLRAEVDDASFQTLWDEGFAMPVEEAIRFALEKGGR